MRKVDNNNNGSFNTGNNNGKQDRIPADGWVNIQGVYKQNGDVLKFADSGAALHGVALNFDKNALTDKLLEAAKNSENGRITMAMVVDIQYVAPKEAPSSDDLDDIKFDF